MEKFWGVWELVAASSIEKEMEPVDTTFTAEFAQLGVSAADLLSDAVNTSGLALEITQDGRFTQNVYGTPNVEWYDDEGAWQRSVTPFNGTWHADTDRLYLIADDRPTWATSKDKTKQKFFRFDDSATVVCDFVEIFEDGLVRTVNVLTDGIYKSHILMKFERRV